MTRDDAELYDLQMRGLTCTIDTLRDGAEDLTVFYQGTTWSETWCETCYAGRGARRKSP